MMIRHLIIGGRGIIGTALRETLMAGNEEVSWTERNGSPPSYHYDLATSSPAELPDADVLYIVAAMAKFGGCEGDRNSWLTNVDGPIRIVRRYSAQTFIV